MVIHQLFVYGRDHLSRFFSFHSFESIFTVVEKPGQFFSLICEKDRLRVHLKFEIWKTEIYGTRFYRLYIYQESFAYLDFGKEDLIC